MVCNVCGNSFEAAATGRPRLFCSGRCRVWAHRNRSLPGELIAAPRWIRHSRKRPITVAGHFASVTNPEHWVSYQDARRSSFGDGLGFVLNGDGIVCIDLDDCFEGEELKPDARKLLDSVGESYTEVSPSGRGLHVWGYNDDLQKGRVTLFGAQKVEVYPSGRYITVTERPLVRARMGYLNLGRIQ